ncbi:MAG: hypothetical protein HC780_17215 [Leptolyngbyaceae cyanobacterium CSU_1_3]|nr:hypothetical protein [Leptolyngbyaceae cyanobacterium CSU_1_3]
MQLLRPIKPQIHDLGRQAGEGREEGRGMGEAINEDCSNLLLVAVLKIFDRGGLNKVETRHLVGDLPENKIPVQQPALTKSNSINWDVIKLQVPWL